MSVKIEVSDEVINADAITLCNPLAVKKAVAIPENPTNGDVIKALFPDNPIDVFIHDVNIRDGLNVVAHFDREWWDAPYKAERSGEVN